MCKPCLHVHRCFRYRAYICGFLPVSPPVEVCNSSVCTGTKVCLRVCTGMRLCACTEECNPSQREPMKETGGAKPTGLPPHPPHPTSLLARSLLPSPPPASLPPSFWLSGSGSAAKQSEPRSDMSVRLLH